MNRTPLERRSRKSIFTRAVELKRTLFNGSTSTAHAFKHPSGVYIQQLPLAYGLGNKLQHGVLTSLKPLALNFSIFL